MRAAIAAIVAGYDRLDPADAPYFAAQRARLETQGFARYDALRREIRARYAGVPVGYSESIFQGLGEDLGLKLATPTAPAESPRSRPARDPGRRQSPLRFGGIGRPCGGGSSASSLGTVTSL